MTDAVPGLFPDPLPATERKPVPWRGRRRVTDPKDQFIAVRCTAAQHAAYDAAATKAGLSIGAYLRTLADGTPGPRAVRRPQVDRTELARALGLLGRYGGNLNQLAFIANTIGELPTRAALIEIATQVREMRAALLKALGRGD